MAGEELNHKQRRFCEEYIRDFNATGAAKRAGYSDKTSHSIGWENLRKPEIKEYVDFLLEEATLSANQTIKSISDIAKGDLKEYFIVTTRLVKKNVKIGLEEHIEQLKESLDTMQYVHDMAMAEGLLGEGKEFKKEVAEFRKAKRQLRMTILSLEVNFAKDPYATIIVPAPPELIETVELDLAKLVRDKDAGKIKSYQMTEFGPKIELYPADAALRDVGRYHKLFDRDKEEETSSIPKKITVEIVPPKPVDE